jgi:hypothetical protein
LRSTLAVPAAIADAGDHGARRSLEFFAVNIRNKNTRLAYYGAVCQFFAWVEQHKIGELADIEPVHVAAYIEALQTTAAKPTVKLHLAAIRMLFDWLIIGQILAVTPPSLCLLLNDTKSLSVKPSWQVTKLMLCWGSRSSRPKMSGLPSTRCASERTVPASALRKPRMSSRNRPFHSFQLSPMKLPT